MPGILLAITVEVGPDDLEHFDLRGQQTTSRAVGGQGFVRELPVAFLECAQLLWVEVRAEKFDLMVVVGTEFGTDIEELLVLKAEDHGRCRVEGTSGQVLESIHRNSIGGPDFYSSVEPGIGGAEIVLTRDGAKQSRRGAQCG